MWPFRGILLLDVSPGKECYSFGELRSHLAQCPLEGEDSDSEKVKQTVSPRELILSLYHTMAPANNVYILECFMESLVLENVFLVQAKNIPWGHSA